MGDHQEFEPNRLRKDYRIKLPARARIKGNEYKVLNWSFAGFALIGFPNDGSCLGEDDNEAPVEFVLPFASYNVTFYAHAELRWSKNGEAGFGLTGIDPKTRMVIREYINACVEGRLAASENVIVKPEEQTAVAIYETPLTLRENEGLRRKLKRHFGLYILLAVVLVLLSTFLIYQHKYVFSTMALVRGNIVEVSNPILAGTIKDIKVKEGDKVTPGLLLFEIDDTDLQREVNAARALVEKRKEAYRKSFQVIQEEQRKVQLYVAAAQQKEKMVKNQLDAIGADLAQAKIESDRAKVLYSHDAINRAEMEVREARYLQLSSQYKAVEEELKLSRLAAEESRDGRFFSFTGTGIQGRMKDLQENLANQEALIKQAEVLLQIAENKLQKTRIVSSCEGVVNTNSRLKGDFVNIGDLVMTVETPSRPWVAARYKIDDAQLIRPGDKAEVYFPSLNSHTQGRVQAIGHDSLALKGLPSIDMETAQMEIPVKVLLEEVPQGVRTGIRAEVRIKTRLYFGIIPKFFWSSVGRTETPIS